MKLGRMVVNNEDKTSEIRITFRKLAQNTMK